MREEEGATDVVRHQATAYTTGFLEMQSWEKQIYIASTANNSDCEDIDMSSDDDDDKSLCEVKESVRTFSALKESLLVAGRTDGPSVNAPEHNGMRGMMQNSHLWLVWS